MPRGLTTAASVVALLMAVLATSAAAAAAAATSDMEALALPPAHRADHPRNRVGLSPPPAFTPAPPNSNMCFGYNISDRVCCGFRYGANGQMVILTCPSGYVCGVDDGVCIRPMQPGAVMGHFGFIAIALCLSLCCLLVCGVTRCCSRIALSLHSRRVDRETRDRAGLLAPTDFSDTDDENGVAIVTAAARRRRRARVVPAVVVDSQSPVDATVAINAEEPRAPSACPYGPSEATGYAVQPTAEDGESSVASPLAEEATASTSD